MFQSIETLDVLLNLPGSATAQQKINTHVRVLIFPIIGLICENGKKKWRYVNVIEPVSVICESNFLVWIVPYEQ